MSIWLARKDRIRASRERDERRLAQARLVLTGTPGVHPRSRGQDGYHHGLAFYFENYRDQPVMDVHAEAWASSVSLDQPPTWATTSRIVLPGPQEPWQLRDVITPDRHLSLRAWRYRWTDADGRQWCVDQPQQPEPLPFKGQQPRPY